MFTLSAPFPGHANAVIVTPTPLKAEVVPNTGVVITPSHLGGVCFQICQYHPHCFIFFLHHSGSVIEYNYKTATFRFYCYFSLMCVIPKCKIKLFLSLNSVIK